MYSIDHVAMVTRLHLASDPETEMHPISLVCMGIQLHGPLTAVFKQNCPCLCSPHSDVSVTFLRLVLTVITFWTPTPCSNIPTLSTIPQVILYQRFKPWSLVLGLDEFRAAQTATARITLSWIDLYSRQFKNHRHLCQIACIFVNSLDEDTEGWIFM